MKLPLVGSSMALRSLAAAASENTNFIVEVIESRDDQAKNNAILCPIPGRHELGDFNVGVNGKIRGLWSGGGRLFIVQGTDVFEALEDGTEKPASRHALAGVVNDDSPAQMFGNANQLLIVVGGQAYVDNGAGPVPCRFLLEGYFTTVDGTHLDWASGAKFTAEMVGRTGTFNGSPIVVDAFTSDIAIEIHSTVGVQAAPVPYSVDGGDLVTAVTAAYINLTAFVQRPSGGSPDLGRQVNFSDPNDFTVWRGLSFKTKEGGPDYIRSILADGEILLIFGTEVSEAWQMDQQTGLPVRIPGSVVPFGSVATYGPVQIGGKVYFVGGTKDGGVVAYRVDGSTPTRISTHAQEEAWRDFAAPVDCVSYAYQEDGHTFCVFNMGAQAWCWDETSKTWHRRADWDVITDGFLTYPTEFHTYIPEWNTNLGMHVTANRTGKIYESSILFGDTAGGPIIARRAIPYRYAGGRRIYFGRQDLEMETGKTTAVAPAAEPTVSRDYSDDRGNTFVNPQPAGIGLKDDFSRRVYWPVGGSSQGRVWRYTISADFRYSLVDLQGEEVEGTV